MMGIFVAGCGGGGNMPNDTGVPTFREPVMSAPLEWSPWSAVRSFTTESVYVPPPPPPEPPPPVKHGKGWGKGGKK